MNTPRSMTGFARVKRTTALGDLTVYVKSLNHRGLDVHFRIPPEFDVYETRLRSLVKKMISRGHVEVRVTFARNLSGGPVMVNRPLLAQYLSAFREAAQEFGVATEPDLNSAFRIPGVFGEQEAPEDEPQLESALACALEEALNSLNAFRAHEGAEIVTLMQERNKAILDGVSQMDEIRISAVPRFQTRLQERLSELLRATNLEPQRLMQEAAMLADRSDIGEEITRLRIHAGQLADLLRTSGEVGKKLDFLLQEMNRETNTILSKTTGIGEMGLGITNLALAAKADIEKIREQSLNLE